jgi:hypothetical protein
MRTKPINLLIIKVMSEQIGKVLLDLGYTSLEDDLNTSLVFKDDGNQDFIETLNSYIQLLKKAVTTLELVRDTTGVDEADNLELITNKDSTGICIRGDTEVIDRYVGFGIATEGEYIDDDDQYESDGTSDTDSSSDYNELCASDDTDTPIGEDDDDEESEEEIEVKPKKVPRK